MCTTIAFNEWFPFKRTFGLSKVIYAYSSSSYSLTMRTFASLTEKVKNEPLSHMKNTFCKLLRSSSRDILLGENQSTSTEDEFILYHFELAILSFMRQ